MHICHSWRWRTPDFDGHDLLSLDEADDLLVDAGGDGIAIDPHNLITHLKITTNIIYQASYIWFYYSQRAK